MMAGDVAGNDIDIYVNCNLGCHPVAAVQYTFTHRQYTERYR